MCTTLPGIPGLFVSVCPFGGYPSIYLNRLAFFRCALASGDECPKRVSFYHPPSWSIYLRECFPPLAIGRIPKEEDHVILGGTYVGQEDYWAANPGQGAAASLLLFTLFAIIACDEWLRCSISPNLVTPSCSSAVLDCKCNATVQHPSTLTPRPFMESLIRDCSRRSQSSWIRLWPRPPPAKTNLPRAPL